MLNELHGLKLLSATLYFQNLPCLLFAADGLGRRTNVFGVRQYCRKGVIGTMHYVSRPLIMSIAESACLPFPTSFIHDGNWTLWLLEIHETFGLNWLIDPHFLLGTKHPPSSHSPASRGHGRIGAVYGWHVLYAQMFFFYRFSAVQYVANRLRVLISLNLTPRN